MQRAVDAWLWPRRPVVQSMSVGERALGAGCWMLAGTGSGLGLGLGSTGKKTEAERDGQPGAWSQERAPATRSDVRGCVGPEPESEPEPACWVQSAGCWVLGGRTVGSGAEGRGTRLRGMGPEQSRAQRSAAGRP